MKNSLLNTIAMQLMVAMCTDSLAQDLSNSDMAPSTHSSPMSGSSDVSDYNPYFFSRSEIGSITSIDSKGGVATIGDFFSVSFPERSLLLQTDVALSISMSNDIDLSFREATFMFPGIKRFPQELRINTGKSIPSSEFVFGKFYISKLSNKIKPSLLSVFFRVEQGGANEVPFLTFDTTEFVYNDEKDELTFKIPGAAFTETLSNEGYEAVIILVIRLSNNN